MSSRLENYIKSYEKNDCQKTKKIFKLLFSYGWFEYLTRPCLALPLIKIGHKSIELCQVLTNSNPIERLKNIGIRP